jgi:hypothetical protein
MQGLLGQENIYKVGKDCSVIARTALLSMDRQLNEWNKMEIAQNQVLSIPDVVSNIPETCPIVRPIITADRYR